MIRQSTSLVLAQLALSPETGPFNAPNARQVHMPKRLVHLNARPVHQETSQDRGHRLAFLARRVLAHLRKDQFHALVVRLVSMHR